MTKNPAPVALRLTDQQIVLGARALAQAMFDMAMRGGAPIPVTIPVAAAPALLLSTLPAIGAEFNGGIYAGLSIDNNQVVALTLLPDDEKFNWNDAKAWAEKQGGTLPSRIDQLVLFKNLKPQFQEAWYWSGEQYASDSGCAWGQYFGYGYQGSNVKGYDGRARAVRRSIIQ